MDRGFDRYFGIPSSLDIPPYYYIEGDRCVAEPTGTIGDNFSEGWTRIQGAFWRRGAIAPGYYADIIAVNGDPLADISELENVSFVMKGGKVYKSD